MSKLRLKDATQFTQHLSRRAEIQTLAAYSETSGSKHYSSGNISSVCISVSFSLPLSISYQHLSPSAYSSSHHHFNLKSTLFCLRFLPSLSVPQFLFHNLFLIYLHHAKMFFGLIQSHCVSAPWCLCNSVCPSASVSPTWLTPAPGPGGHQANPQQSLVSCDSD